MRFYDVNGGRILFDGVDISKVTRKELRANFGMVLQDTWLFKGTIAENIAYGKPDATREEIIEAAKLAKCDSFIRKLPQGCLLYTSSHFSKVFLLYQNLQFPYITMLSMN